MLTERAYRHPNRERENAFPPRPSPRLGRIGRHGRGAPRTPRWESLRASLPMRLQPIDYLYIVALVAVVVLSAYILIHG